jgi:predicted nucleotidyltransferase
MDKQEVIAKLREYEAELRARGVRHAALFGSIARGSATAEAISTSCSISTSMLSAMCMTMLA